MTNKPLTREQAEMRRKIRLEDAHRRIVRNEYVVETNEQRRERLNKDLQTLPRK